MSFELGCTLGAKCRHPFPEIIGPAGFALQSRLGLELAAEITPPPRQNSCRLIRILNLGATRKRDGTVRRSIQDPGGGAVVAAGERQCWRGGEGDWSVGPDLGTLA